MQDLPIKETTRVVNISARDKVEFIESRFSAEFREFYPRKYAAPGGYYSPKSAAMDHVFSILAAQATPKDHVLARIASAAIRLLNFAVPTYWVSRELTTALLQTNPPSAMTPGDVAMSFPAMQFMLPENVFADTDGGHFTCLTLAALEPGWVGKFQGRAMFQNALEHPGLIVVGYTSNGIGWSSWVPMQDTIEVAHTRDFEVFAYIGSEQTTKTATSEDALRIQKLNTFALSLLVYMMSRPEEADAGNSPDVHEMLRKANPRKQVEALWAPKWVGRNYKIPGLPQGGTHASPRMHWRCGHQRVQRHGPNNSLRKFVMIDPVLVNSNGS